MIANSGHDENGRYKNGKAGDQTGTEYAVIPWYNRPWTCVLRYPNKTVAADIAYCARAAAENDKIGYDQNQRDTFWRALASVPNYGPAKITTPCESDCTCGVATCVKAAGLRKGDAMLRKIDPDYYWSGNMREGFMHLGFRVLTDPKYLTSDRYLLPGDILLYDNHHAAVNLDAGAMVRDEWAGVPTYQTGWNRDDKGWWYADTEHTYVKDKWMLINRCYYWFNSEGYAVTGFQEIYGEYYIFNPIAGDPKECAMMVTDEQGHLKVYTKEGP